MGKQWKQWQTIFWGSKITADGDGSHEFKRCLLLGRKAMTNLDSILKSRDITLLTKVHLVKAIIFPVVMYGCESWIIKNAKCRRIDAFELWCWRRLLRVPWTARRSNQSILKESSPEYSLEGLMLKLKLQYLATWWEELTHCKRPWCWERLKAGGEEGDRGWLDCITDSMDTSLSNLPELVIDGEAWSAAAHAVPKSQTGLNEQKLTELTSTFGTSSFSLNLSSSLTSSITYLKPNFKYVTPFLAPGPWQTMIPRLMTLL